MHLSAIGYIQVHAYTSNAQIPLKDVAIMITNDLNKAIAFRITDRSGRIDPVPIEVPEKSVSQAPDLGKPYTTVNIYARLEGFEQIESRNVQVFSQTVTDQNLEMIPLSELPESMKKTEIFNTPAQNL